MCKEQIYLCFFLWKKKKASLNVGMHVSVTVCVWLSHNTCEMHNVSA